MSMLHTSKTLTFLLTTLTTGGLFTACMNDDTTQTEVSNECVLTGMKMEHITRTLTTRTKDGKRDSTYNVKVTATNYPLTIDQQRNLIYNVDSLPMHTNLKKVLVGSLTAIGGYTLKSLTTGNDTILSLKDTLDFSQPRDITIHGADGVSKRTYRVELRAHREEGDSVVWTSRTAAEWATQNFEIPAAGTFTALGRTYALESSPWALISKLSDGSDVKVEAFDAPAEVQPFTNMTGAAQPTRTNNNLQEVLLYAHAGSNAVLYKRYIDATGKYTFKWTYLPSIDNEKYKAPLLTQARLLAFDDGYLLAGLDAAGKVVVKYSIDRGRTWKAHPSLRLPAGLPVGTTFEAALDSRHNLWLRINGTEVWRAHLNRLGWTSVPTIFYKAPKK